MFWIIFSFSRMGRKVIQVRFDNMLYIVKRKIHNPLDSGPNVLQEKQHLLIHESTLGEDEGSLMLVLSFNLDLIISQETIHKRKDFATGTCINYLIYERCG